MHIGRDYFAVVLSDVGLVDLLPEIVVGAASDSPITVNVTCDPNTSYDDRTSTVTITQAAKSGLIVEGQSDYSLEPDAQSLEVEVKANVEYDVNISADWIKQAGTKALSSSTLIFSVEENTTPQARSASISISGARLSQFITVNQDPAPNTASSKIIKSYRANSDYPDFDFPVISMAFTYDEAKRPLKAVCGFGDGALTAVNIKGWGESFLYQWEGNDLYSFTYTEKEYADFPGFHFESSGFYAPVNGVDINSLICAFASTNPLHPVLYQEESLLLPLLTGMTGKRSEHALSIILDDIEIVNEKYPPSLSALVSNHAEYKGLDGNWHLLTKELVNNWASVGTFAVRCAGIPHKTQSKPWEWTSQDGFLTSTARWPIVVSTATLSCNMVVSLADSDGDGSPDPYAPIFRLRISASQKKLELKTH